MGKAVHPVGEHYFGQYSGLMRILQMKLQIMLNLPKVMIIRAGLGHDSTNNNNNITIV